MSGLTVREHVRIEFNLPVELVIHDAHQDQVRFSRSSSALDQRSINCRSLDLSPGGMALSSRHFIPRMCEASLRVFDPVPIGKRRDGTPILDVIFEHEVKIRRVQMTGHEPTYLLGVAFIDPAPDLDQRTANLLERAGLTETGNSSGPCGGKERVDV